MTVAGGCAPSVQPGCLGHTGSATSPPTSSHCRLTSVGTRNQVAVSGRHITRWGRACLMIFSAGIRSTRLAVNSLLRRTQGGSGDD